jgi:hypothetical protein
MPIFKDFSVINSRYFDVGAEGALLYSENTRKRPNFGDFAHRGARRSGSYVNMVKVGFQRGEIR